MNPISSSLSTSNEVNLYGGYCIDGAHISKCGLNTVLAAVCKRVPLNFSCLRISPVYVHNVSWLLSRLCFVTCIVEDNYFQIRQSALTYTNIGLRFCSVAEQMRS